MAVYINASDFLGINILGKNLQTGFKDYNLGSITYNLNHNSKYHYISSRSFLEFVSLRVLLPKTPIKK